MNPKTGKPKLAPCGEACPADAIDRSKVFDPKGEIVEVAVGSISAARWAACSCWKATRCACWPTTWKRA